MFSICLNIIFVPALYKTDKPERDTILSGLWTNNERNFPF